MTADQDVDDDDVEYRRQAITVTSDAAGRIAAGTALYLTGDWSAAHQVAAEVAPKQPAAVMLLDLAYLVAGTGIVAAAGGEPDRVAAAHNALQLLSLDLAASRDDPVALVALLNPQYGPPN